MASVCMPQSNYQQQHFNIMLLQHQQHQNQQHSSQFHAKHQQRIAPASSKILGNSNLHNIQAVPSSQNFGPMLAKKKYTYANMPYGEQLPSVARRNARERNRVKQVNNGFSNLRQHLPQTVINALSNGGRGAAKKLSKVDTLRIAVEYIRGLQDLLDETHPTDTASVNAHLLDDCSSEDSNYADSSIGSPVDEARQTTTTTATTTTLNHLHSYHSEASASPTPSYCDSDISIGGAAQYMQPLKLEEEQFKFEAFGNYNDQPDDEELLDYISSWQEQ